MANSEHLCLHTKVLASIPFHSIRDLRILQIRASHSIMAIGNSFAGRIFLCSQKASPKSLTICRWFALIRIWSPWLAPRQGKKHFALDKDAVLCSFMEPGGRHLVLLAISGVQDVMTLFRSDLNGNVVLNVRRTMI